jgi:hypothetical protein
MRLTGEPGTYDDNTDYNLALLNLKFAISTHAILVSGDDSVIHPAPSTRPSWSKVANFFAVRSKEIITTYPSFCGYLLGPAGAIRDPLPLLAKIAIALADESITLKHASYLSEFLVGHSLGDAFWSLLPEEAFEAQNALYDYFRRRSTREQRLALNIGPLPQDLVTKLLSSGFALPSYPFYSLLDRTTRLRVLRTLRKGSYRETPNHDQLDQTDSQCGRRTFLVE